MYDNFSHIHNLFLLFQPSSLDAKENSVSEPEDFEFVEVQMPPASVHL